VSSGKIDIAARRDGARLVISVTDDGPGAATPVALAREGVGLGNTRARLEALYGSRHRLDLTNLP
jgi:two-component system LytT family sensor kinase